MTVVPEELDGERADRVIAVLFEVSRSVAKRTIEAGGATRDGEPLRPADRMAAGDELEASITAQAVAVEPQEVDFGVAYEDDTVVVVNKPAGLVVHPGAGAGDRTLANGLLARFPWAGALGPEHRWGIVHRLDRDTSGLLVVAKTEEAHAKLQDALRNRTVTRRYLALVAGTLDAATGTIEAPIGRDPLNPTRMAVTSSGRPARTHYRELASWDDQGVTLLSVELDSGRTHQIRVHLQAIEHPIVGDPAYGPRHAVAGDPGRPWLHATHLAFVHPTSAEQVEVGAPLPSDLAESLANLGEPTSGVVPTPE